MTNEEGKKMKVFEKEIGIYYGWQIKCVSLDDGKLFYMAYFVLDEQHLPVMLDSDNLEALKKKIKCSKYTKFSIRKNKNVLKM